LDSSTLDYFPWFVNLPKKSMNLKTPCSVHIVAVINHSTKDTHLWIVSSLWKEGPNVILTIFYYEIKDYLASLQNSRPIELHIQEDNCFRENKNVFLIGFMDMLIKYGKYKKSSLILIN
jgi:hypothetical protein